MSASTTNYTPNGLNQISQIGSTAMSHDARGNMTGDGASSFTYNTNNLLTSATVSDQSAGVRYDAENRLARTARSGFTTTRFLYDGVNLIAEYNDAGTTVLRRYVHGAAAL